MFAHLAGLFVLAHLTFANVIAPLVFYIMARNEGKPFTIEHARASLNFQITFSLFVIVAFMVGFAAVGAGFLVALATAGDHAVWPPVVLIAVACLLVAVLLLAVTGNVVSCVLGAVAASNGRSFRYPLAIPFVR